MATSSTQYTTELSDFIAWWETAGVDCVFDDDATQWLGQAPQKDLKKAPPDKKTPPDDHKKPPSDAVNAQPPAKKPVTRFAFLNDSPPQTLEQFTKIWLEEPEIDPMGPQGRVPPRGKEDAALMVLVLQPEENDTGQLLSGPQGRFVENVIAATQLAQDAVYIASALPRHTPLADQKVLATQGFDQLLAWHIDLVRPQQVLAFGDGLQDFLGPILTSGPGGLRKINRDGSSTSFFLTQELGALMASPRLKARFWRRWVEWSMHEQGSPA